MHRLLLILSLAALLVDCASSSSLRHKGTVSLAATHATLSLIDDTENKLVCNRAGAPPAPLCVPIAQHRQISVYLAQAFGLERRAAGMVRALPDGSELPADVYAMSAEIAGLVQAILDLMPDAQPRSSLVTRAKAAGYQNVR